MLATSIGLILSSAALAEGNTASTQKQYDEQQTERITVRGAYFGQQAADSVKTPTLLIDVPQFVSVVSAEQIQQQALQSVADVVQYTPGVTIGLGEDHRDQMTIRGQNTTADFFVDGLRDDVQYFRPLYNLERVEILRGANALLFGRGGGGGIINRVTKEAELSGTFSAFSANLDTFGASMATIDTNQVIDGSQALRLNAFHEQVDNHRDFKNGSRYGVNPTYSWAISPDTKLVLSYEYLDDDRLVDRGIPSENGKPAAGHQDTYFGDPDFNRTTLQAQIARARIDHMISSNWSLNATLQYADYDKFYQNLYPVAFDSTAATVKLDGYRDGTDRDNLIFQFNAVGQFDTGSVSHTLLAGFEYGDQDTANYRKDALFVDSNDDQITFEFSNPLEVPEFGLTGVVRDTASNVKFTSAFVQDEIALFEQLILVAGLRYDRFDIDVLDVIEQNNGSEDGNNGALGRVDEEISPRVGLIYKPLDNVSVYASLSQSFLPRSGDQFLTLSLSSQALAPEEFENREVGVKWNLSDALSLSAAVFEIERENGSVTDPANPERSLLTGTETKGFEFQLAGQLADNWSVSAGYSNLDGQEMGRVADGEVNNRTLAQVPEHMVSLWSRYGFSDKLSAALGVVYQSEQYASLGNAVELPDFTRVDMAVYYQLSDALQVQLNVENLLDEEYFPSAHNDNNIATGEPLNARLGVSYTF
ncbi:TonB-dependent siderophore receptor [Alteromonas aestuariivivens]|uniref:TonB-dependent siderophore receptor n=1 Tax=Alteromonas aestuariivivens TaxID=1938339 RepID=A0A3D8MA36_9ALTE|nr:TonB-dependent siderophore receptor [Alteromonas aestuariivivens]